MSAILLFTESYPALSIGAVALLGAIIGSFLNVVIHRLPIMMENDWRNQCQSLINGEHAAPPASPPFNLVVPRSRCPHCGHGITAIENIPLLSYLWQKGKCRACGQSIHWRYPFVEMLAAMLGVAVIWKLGFTFSGLAALTLTWALIALTFIDIDHQLLPDSITLPFLWLGLLINITGGLTDLGSAVVGAIVGYLFLWAIYHLFRLLTGKEGMGYGDFKLYALFGAWLGWQQLPLIILLASLVGAILGIAAIVLRGRDRNLPIPFGPFLAIAGWIAMLWGDELTRAYLRIARLGF